MTKKRWAHEAKGKVLRSRHGVIYVPYEERGRGSWSAVTLYDPAGVYPPGGYNIVVGQDAIENDEAVKVEGVPDE